MQDGFLANTRLELKLLRRNIAGFVSKHENVVQLAEAS
jgi:hypothetical protein